jgi:GTPase SAR1 family protein
MTQPPQSPVQAALSALAVGQQAANAYGRPDLANRLGASAARLVDSSFQVLVIGEFKQGKSSLVNQLVGSEVCPTDDDIATAVPTIVRSAAEPTAAVQFQPDDDEGGGRSRPPAETILLSEVPMYASELGASETRRVHSVEIGLPSPILNGGLVLIDTPGVGGLGSTHGAITAAALPMAEAIIFVTDAGQEFTAPELEFMETARRLCPNIVCLLSKIDFYPAWRKIRDLNLAHLERLGINAPLIAISSTLHDRAIATEDGELLDESGYPELTAHISNNILAQAAQLSVIAAASDLHDVIDQLTEHFATRKAVLEDPEAAQAKMKELEQAKTRADELKSRSSRWQVTLNDGVQDLNTEIDHDLRDRFRRINEEAGDALNDVDPAEVWSEFERWLCHRASVEVIKNYELLQDRSQDLVSQVAEHFEMESIKFDPTAANLDPTASLAEIQSGTEISAAKAKARDQALTGLRGGYSGMMMFGMLSSMVGLALGPIGIGLGVVMGRKQIREEKARQLSQRQTQARNAQRKYMDEVSFRTNKDSRDALRTTHRQIRDHFTERAEEQSTSIRENLAGVQAAAQADQQGRSRQITDVNAELDRLSGLRAKADAVSRRSASTTPVGGRT